MSERKEIVLDAMRRLDVAKARITMGAPPDLISDADILVALHKMRYEAGGLIEDPLRMQSYYWLRDHHHLRQAMRPLLPEGELPAGIHGCKHCGGTLRSGKCDECGLRTM